MFPYIGALITTASTGFGGFAAAASADESTDTEMENHNNKCQSNVLQDCL